MPIATPQGTLDFKSVDKVTFVGASSNTVIDTTTGSLGVGVGVGGPTSNLHVVGNTRLEGDINMLHTANTASIKLNSNVVAEFPRSKKLIKYPRVLLTSETSGGYIVTSSEEISGGGTAAWQNWKPFGGFFPNNNHAWLTGNGSYPSAAGVASTSGTTEGDALPQNLGTDSGGSATANGSWLKLQLPHKITLEYIRMNGNGVVAPDDFDVLGSNDDTNWNILGSFTTPNPQIFTRMDQFVISATTPYLYYAIIIKSHRGNSHTYSGIYNLEYYGTPEYDPDAHGTDVTVKSVANVPNTDWLERYYDAKNYSSGSTILDEVTATHRDATINGSVPLDTTGGINSWSFNGNASNFILGDDNVDGIPSSGDWAHSMSIWFKTTDMSDDQNIVMILASANLDGSTPATSSTSAFYLRGKNNGTSPRHIQIIHWSQDVRINYIFNENEWYHVTYVYSGGGVSSTTQSAYVNGVRVPFLEDTRSTATLGDPLNISSVSRVVLGKRYYTSSPKPVNGSIANFRLFNRALTSDEIYQLYAYQKEYFGYGDLSMTLKAGRLGIGTSEPRAALDVRGRIMREYNPGEIIETIRGKANGRYVTVQSGTYLLPNVSGLQDLTSTHTRITGSNFDYTPPPGTTRVIYEFWCFLRQGDPRPIIHFQGRVGGTIVNDSRHTFRDNTDTGFADPQIWLSNYMCITIGEVTSDNIAGGQLAAWNGPRTIDFTAREYNDSYEGRLHVTNHWDGSGDDILVRPTIKITAIA